MIYGQVEICTQRGVDVVDVSELLIADCENLRTRMQLEQLAASRMIYRYIWRVGYV